MKTKDAITVIENISLKEDDILVISLASDLHEDTFREVVENIKSNLKRLGFKNEVLIIDDRTKIFKIGKEYE
jgi:hypothetical protein